MSSHQPTDENRVCVFCQKIEEGSVQREALRVYSFEPLNPVTPGHRLFIVDEHFAFPHHEPTLAGLAYSAAARHAGERGGAYNLIVNAGDAASQTIPHVHVHYVPRERNDGLKLPWTEQHEATGRSLGRWQYCYVEKWVDGSGIYDRVTFDDVEKARQHLADEADEVAARNREVKKRDRVVASIERRRITDPGPWEPAPAEGVA